MRFVFALLLQWLPPRITAECGARRNELDRTCFGADLNRFQVACTELYFNGVVPISMYPYTVLLAFSALPELQHGSPAQARYASIQQNNLRHAIRRRQDQSDSPPCPPYSVRGRARDGHKSSAGGMSPMKEKKSRRPIFYGNN